MPLKTPPLLLIATGAFLISACSTAPTQPVIVEDAGTTPIEREKPIAEEIEAPVQTNTATNALMLAAKSALDAAEPNNAITYLERAVRIDPRNAELWIALSQAHMADGNLRAANQHVRKAIALANGNQALTREAWLQLADVREAEGNPSEARAIRKQYAGLRG